jgi:hypothetical protein
MNEVILEAFEYQNFALKTGPSEGGIIKTTIDYGGGGKPIPIETFRILLDSEGDLPPLAYTHAWKQPDTSVMGDVFKAINEKSSQLTTVIDAIQNAAALLDSDMPYTNKPITKLDFQKVYKESNYPGIDINFTAFTNNNFIDDVYTPIMKLIALTHPKRYNSKDETNELGEVQGATQDAKQGLIEAVALSARQYTLQSPCLFNLYHQSGLYSLSNCMCNSISVSYQGPWYNASIDEQQMFDNLSNKSLIQNINRRSFPTIAKVSMKFESGERLTRDDFTTLASNFIGMAGKGANDTGKTTITRFAGNQG